MRSNAGSAVQRTNSARGAARPAQKPTTMGRPASNRNSARGKAGASASKIQIQNEPSPMPDVLAGQQTTMTHLPGGGVTGSGEELALTLEKVVSQLDIISRTLHVLEQRVSMNEESVANCLTFFKEARDAR